MADKQERVDVDEVLRQLDRKYNQVRVVYRSPEPAAAVLDCLRNKEEIRAGKFFHADGKVYNPGDVFEPGGISEEVLARLASQYFIQPGKNYDRAKAAAELADLLNKADPLRSTLNQERQKVTRAAAKVEAKRAELVSAQHEYNTAVSAVEGSERRLAEFLQGDDVSHLLKK